ncbi:MAG: hypothetical protein ACYDGR_07245 [Candidatus Dormibacteria bacterium]
MRITQSEAPNLPAAAALVDNTGAVVAATKEWPQDAVDSAATTAYRMGSGAVLIAGAESMPHSGWVLEQLVAAIRGAAARMDEDQAMAAELYATGLEVTTGRRITEVGSLSSILELLRIGVARRTRLAALTPLGLWDESPVVGASAIALALVQLAVNAEAHGQAHRLAIEVEGGPTFIATWEDPTATGEPDGPTIKTSRSRLLRERFGMAYVRQVCDALGGVVSNPSSPRPGIRQVVLSFGTARLALPLAQAIDGRIQMSTKAWVEETRIRDQDEVAGWLAELQDLAQSRQGEIVERNLFTARAVEAQTWFMLPPHGDSGRVGDALQELIHEKPLWRETEPESTKIHALSAILDRMLGLEWHNGASPATFAEIFPARCRDLGVAPSVAIHGYRFPDPRIAAYLLAEVGETVTDAGGSPAVVVRADRRGHPLVEALAEADGVTIHLGN